MMLPAKQKADHRQRHTMSAWKRILIQTATAARYVLAEVTRTDTCKTRLGRTVEDMGDRHASDECKEQFPLSQKNDVKPNGQVNPAIAQ